VVFSSDTVADDWHRRIKPRDIIQRAMSRLEKRGKAFCCFTTSIRQPLAALPELLNKLKEGGFQRRACGARGSRPD